MVKVVSGFMRVNGGTSAAVAIKRFRKNCDKEGVIVRNVVFCHPIGDNVFRIVAHVEMKE